MQPIVAAQLQPVLDSLANQELYVHLETTQGAYANFRNKKASAFGAFIRNARIQYARGRVTGNGPFRVGLKLESGWLYAEGLTHWTNEADQLLIYGLDSEGRLQIALQLGTAPFGKGGAQ